MKILFIGDIMGRAGREALETHLPKIKERYKPDAIVVNGENAAHGNGINPKMCEAMFSLGVDCITSGNHIWDQREIMPYIQRERRLLRPVNFPAGAPGNGAYKLTAMNGQTLVVINAMARLFMDAMDCPFQAVENILKTERLGQTCDAIFVDFHGESTSEKMAFGHYFDGRISGVIGTHTHIPTADYHVMKGGTAYMSDAGMTGDYDSVIGIEKNVAIHRFTKKIPGPKKQPASGPGCLCGAIIETGAGGKATSIEPIRVGAILSNT